MMCTGAFQQQVFQPAKNQDVSHFYVTQYHALCGITCLPAVIFSGDEINNGLNESRGGRGLEVCGVYSSMPGLAIFCCSTLSSCWRISCRERDSLVRLQCRVSQVALLWPVGTGTKYHYGLSLVCISDYPKTLQL